MIGDRSENVIQGLYWPLSVSPLGGQWDDLVRAGVLIALGQLGVQSIRPKLEEIAKEGPNQVL